MVQLASVPNAGGVTASEGSPLPPADVEGAIPETQG